MKKKKQSSSTKEENFAEEWEIGKGMGILPDDIPLTQNIGCVGGKTKSSKTKTPNSKE
ncbi:hypothetical protein AAGF08_00225 [Algoriphagus sp. SE2]|uniref:hypothetical protein n=1 Tax=Algoriphagus sp. SE2 TaxID=3141536 RepID=UPI0031CD1BA2